MKDKTLKIAMFFYTTLILLILSNILTLKAMREDEDDISITHPLRIISVADLQPLPGEYFLPPHSTTPPLLKPISLESESNPQVLDENDKNVALAHRISNLYIKAFQGDLDKKISRAEALKYITCLAGGIGPFIPQIAIIKTIAEDYGSKLLGYTLITTNAITIEAITAWMIWELIDDTKSLIKKAREPQNDSDCCAFNLLKSMAVGFSSVALGVLSSAPDVYIKYKYNDIKWIVLISLVYDSLPRTIGFYKFFSSLELDKIKNLWKAPSSEERQGTKVVDISRAYFLQKCKENGIESVCNTLSSYTSSKEIYSYLTSNIELDLVEADSPSNFAKGIPRKTMKYISVILPLASAAFNITMAYKGFESFIDNEPTCWLLSAFSVLPAFFLSSYVVMEAAGNVFDKIYLCRSKTPSSDYFTTFHPKLNIGLFTTALLLASVNSVSTFYLISDNLKDTILSPVKDVIAALAVGTDCTFGTYTVYSTFKRYGELIYKKCSKGTSYVINCSKNLSDLGSSFINFSSNLITEFIDETIIGTDDVAPELS